MDTTYSCFFIKEEVEEELLLSNLYPMPTNNCFLIHLKYIHHLQINFPQQFQIPTDSSLHTFLVTFDDLFTRAPTVLSTMLSNFGTPDEFVHQLSLDLIDFATNLIANAPPHDMSTRRPRILPMTFNIVAQSSYHNEIQELREVSFNDEADNFRPVVSHNLSITDEILKKIDIDSSSSSSSSFTAGSTCSICLEELLCERINMENNNSNIVSTPCSHVFHKDCIVRWLETSGSCPLCRFIML